MDVDLTSPDWWAATPPEVVHDTLRRLRSAGPVHWNRGRDAASGCWMVLGHAEVSHVARHPEVFSAAAGGVVVEDLDPATLEGMRRMLLAMDPPGHTLHRRPLAPHFAPRVMAAMEDEVRSICDRVLDSVPDAEEVDHVHDVCGPLPALVIARLFGLPTADVALVQGWAERATGAQDSEVAGSADEVAGAMLDMAAYFMALGADRRSAPPRDDLTSVILGTTFDGAPMDDEAFAGFMVQLVIAGNDTTRTMLSSGTLALVEHPDQMAAVRADPTTIPGAVEEVLRWANPLHCFRRTAVADTDLAGSPIRAGDKVVMLYTSANRDEAVFADPDRFDIGRHPNPHLSFGTGPHVCLGAHLARLEGRVFFSELTARFSHIEVAGEPVRVRSNLNNGLRTLPLRLRR